MAPRQEPDLMIKVGPWSCFCYLDHRPELSQRHELLIDDVDEPRRVDHQREEDSRLDCVVRDDLRLDRFLNGDALNTIANCVARSQLEPIWDDNHSHSQSSELRCSNCTTATMELETISACDGEGREFEGQWTLMRVEGDFDGFLKECGTNYMMRMAAKSMAYGVKRMTNSIKQWKENGIEHIEVIAPSVKGERKQVFRIDNTEQDSVEPLEMKPIIVQPTWDGQTLVVTSRPRDNKAKKMPVSRRFMFGQQMVVQQESPGGIVIRRYFDRQK